MDAHNLLRFVSSNKALHNLKKRVGNIQIKGLWGRLTDEIELKWEWLCCDIL